MSYDAIQSHFFLKIQQVKKWDHLQTFMHQLVSQSPVAGFEY